MNFPNERLASSEPGPDMGRAIAELQENEQLKKELAELAERPNSQGGPKIIPRRHHSLADPQRASELAAIRKRLKELKN